MTTFFSTNLFFSYLGRKKLFHDKEDRVEGSKHLVKPVYSYWTLAYLLSKSGAKKLIAAKPLSKMMAVDEYLCLMFDEHPRLVSGDLRKFKGF